MSPKDSTFSESFNSGFSCVEVWFTEQNSKPLGVEYKINIILVINPRKAGGLFCLSPYPPYGFSKAVFSREKVKPWFFLGWGVKPLFLLSKSPALLGLIKV